ncbi:DUF459 domain-containing protein [Rhizobiales bacterium]|uniref:SGNH/GDSL hydrolase family protein n=1 Tax=Hongsoonwoonella zoysiae TaxID=2821844 RepID=UPI00155FE293|nr:DUF459 domain-containing protein [Hongsoonwoonella zoysiae]NRG17302.1 DUF459 domain-containing protein [Hongsoonwoonella zoysiae]
MAHLEWGKLAFALFVAFVSVTLVATDPAFAQKRIPPPPSDASSFNPLKPLLNLFGIGKRKEKRRLRQEQTERSQPQQQRRREPAKPKIVEEPKDEDARVVLVVGDAMADGLSEGLVAAYAETPSIKVEKLIFKDKGLVDQPEPDYPTRVQQILQGRDIAIVVMFVGAEDVRDMPAEPEKLEFRSEAWENAYKGRLEKLAKTVSFYQTPLVWVGLPPTKATAKRTSFAYLNGLSKARAEASGAIFVDIWDVFLSEDGKYTSYGPDVEGQKRRLRDGEGFGFTWSGYRKVAFFCEREISRVIGSSGAFAFDGVEDDPNFIVLTGRTTSPESELAGGEGGLPEPVAETVQHRLIVRGEALPPVIGRVDDFRVGSP